MISINDYMNMSAKERRESVQVARELAANSTSFISVRRDESVSAVDGPLSGIPFSAKDNIDVEGMVTTVGTRALMENMALADAPVIALLRGAGAVPIGKNNMYELAHGNTSENSTFGTVPNPVDPSRMAGGSSGGSAAAVAAGIVPFALGTDTAGSVREPAAWCGVVGFRPSVGSYPPGRIAPLSSTRDTVGVLASTVADVACVDKVMRIAMDGPMSALGAVVLGIPAAIDPASFDQPVYAAWNALLERLAASSVNVVHVDLDLREIYQSCERTIIQYELAELLPRYLRDVNVSGGVTLEQLLEELSSPLSKPVIERIASGGRPSADEYQTALSARETMRNKHQRAFDQNGITALLYPTLQVTAPPLSDTETTSIGGKRVPLEVLNQYMGPSSVVGSPAITIPVSTIGSPLPVGVSLEGPVGGDRELLALAIALETVFGG